MKRVESKGSNEKIKKKPIKKEKTSEEPAGVSNCGSYDYVSIGRIDPNLLY